MKLLLDENLSPRLPAQLVDLYPGSSQIEFQLLRESRDEVKRFVAIPEEALLVISLTVS